jgi:methyl-accepting chemotaxis protein
VVHDLNTLDARIQEAVADMKVLRERVASAEEALKELRSEVRSGRLEHAERIGSVSRRVDDMDTRIDVLHEAAKAQSLLAAETGRFADRVTAQVMWTADVIGRLAQQAGIETPPKPSAPPQNPRRSLGR